MPGLRVNRTESRQTPAQPSVWDECWATDAAVQDGHYYFYLSIGSDQVGAIPPVILTSIHTPQSFPTPVPHVPAVSSSPNTLHPPSFALAPRNLTRT